MTDRRLILSALAACLAVREVHAFSRGWTPQLVPRALAPTAARPAVVAPATHVPRRCLASPLTLAAAAENEIEYTEAADDEAPIIVHDRASGRTIECYPEAYATVAGTRYVVAYPCDTPIAITPSSDDAGVYADIGEDADPSAKIAMSDSDDLDDLLIEPIENEDALMEDLFPVVESLVEEVFDEEAELVRSAVTLTLAGDIDFDDDDAELDSELDDEAEAVQLLAEFEHDDVKYDLVRILDPMLLLVKPDDDKGEHFSLLPDDEAATVAPLVEMHLQDGLDAIDDELFEEVDDDEVAPRSV